jgi:hypothetical protein
MIDKSAIGRRRKYCSFLHLLLVRPLCVNQAEKLIVEDDMWQSKRAFKLAEITSQWEALN